MKRYIVILISVLSLSLVGCDAFLNRQPDEPKTSQNIFEKKMTTRDYLINVYGWLNNETDPSGQNNVWEGASDECSVSFGNRPYRIINNGTWMVSSNPNSISEKQYSLYWKGIREASFFMENAGRCPELSPEELKEWCGEARFLRAYFYFCLMRMYGPVPLSGYVTSWMKQRKSFLWSSHRTGGVVQLRVPHWRLRLVCCSTLHVRSSMVTLCMQVSRTTMAKTFSRRLTTLTSGLRLQRLLRILCSFTSMSS